MTNFDSQYVANPIVRIDKPKLKPVTIDFHSFDYDCDYDSKHAHLFKKQDVSEFKENKFSNEKKLQDLVKELQGFEELERETELLPLNIHTSTRYYSPFQKSLNTCSDSNNRTKPLFNSI